MTDKFNVSKNIRFSIVSFAINIALVFISYRLVIVYEGIEGLGLWSLLMAWAGIVRLGDVGMGGAILRFVSSKNLETDIKQIQMYIDTGIVMNFIAFLFLTLLGYFILHLNLHVIVSEDRYNQAVSILPIMFANMFFSSLASVMISSIQSLHYGYIGSYLTVIGNLIQITCVLILVPKIGLLGLVLAQLIQYIILTIVGKYIISKKIKSSNILSIKFSKKALYEMFGFSLKAQVANISNGFFEPLSKILINQFGGLQAQGLYELAYKTVSLARNTIVTGLFASLPTLTNLMNTDRLEARKFYLKSQNTVLKSIVFVLLSVIIVSPFISLIWIGSFKNDYWYFTIIIALGFGINTFGATAYNLGMATGKMKNNIISSIVMIGNLLVFGYTLGNLLGIIGVVIAVGISLALSGILIKVLNEKNILKKKV